VDYIILSADEFPHAVLQQSHGGLLGCLQRTILDATGSICFDRSNPHERSKMKQKIIEYAKGALYSCPLLIFPEGVCVNNTCIIRFQRGAFQPKVCIFPVAIKYSARFDAYWNTNCQSFIRYMWRLITNHRLHVKVRYLPAVYMKQGETAEQFANRTQRIIAISAGLPVIDFDGRRKPRIKKKILL